MKNFMKKLPVMITLLALTAVWLGVYLFMQLRPIAYGMQYKHTETEENEITTTYYELGCDNKARIIVVEEDTDAKQKTTSDYTVWYIKEGKYIAFGYIDKETNANRLQFAKFEDFEKYVKDNKILDKDKVEANYNSKEFFMYTMTSTAFTAQICYQGGTNQVIHNCVNNETITFSVVGGIVILVLLAGAVWSTLLFVKERKNKPATAKTESAE